MTTSDTATDERWYVQFDSQEVRLMTLDELDEAFQQGLIHENTYLIKVGEKNWQTLADTLGSTDEEEPAVEQQAVPSAPAPVQHLAAAPIPGRAAAAPKPAERGEWPPPASNAPVGGGWPPVVSAPSGGYAPVSAPSTSQQTFGPRSTVPVVQDVSDLDFDAPFKRSRRGVWLFAAAAVALVGGGAFALTRLDAPKLPAAAAAPAMTAAAALTPYRPPAREEPKAAPPAAPAPAPEPAKTAAAKPEDARFSEDMKQALLAADKDRAVKKSSRAAPARRVTAKAARSKGRSKGTGFKGSGNAHDPLDPTL